MKHCQSIALAIISDIECEKCNASNLRVYGIFDHKGVMFEKGKAELLFEYNNERFVGFCRALGLMDIDMSLMVDDREK